MTTQEGRPIWYELLTGDPSAAERFYSDVVGWSLDDTPVPGYRALMAPDGSGIGGVMKMPDGMKGGPTWLGYFCVENVDEAVSSIEEGGGATLMPATDIAQVGRIAMVADPQGAPFYVMCPTPPADKPDALSTAFLQGDESSPGHVVWNELTSPSPDDAIDFYRDQFGWREEGSMPMGDLGDYRFIHAGSTNLGAVMGEVPSGRPGWHYYFHVDEIDSATDRLRAGGGTVVQGPDEIPGGTFAVVAEDPEGARFGLVGPRHT